MLGLIAGLTAAAWTVADTIGVITASAALVSATGTATAKIIKAVKDDDDDDDDDD